MKNVNRAMERMKELDLIDVHLHLHNELRSLDVTFVSENKLQIIRKM